MFPSTQCWTSWARCCHPPWTPARPSSRRGRYHLVTVFAAIFALQLTPVCSLSPSSSSCNCFCSNFCTCIDPSLLSQSKFHSIKDLIQTDKVPFLVKKVSPKTNVDLDERPEVSSDAKQLRLSQWSPNHSCGEAGQFIDILYEHAQAATNCPDIRSACALLELAANAGALSVVVCFNQYRPGQKQTKSTLYGYPMIDTKTLLSCIQVCSTP